MSFRLRAHHGMCLAFFEGKGYSSTFVENMWQQKEYLETINPTIEIVTCTDSICEKCPNNDGGICTSMDKVEAYDQKVLEFCELESTTCSWQDYSSIVAEKVLMNGRRKEICGDCCWNSICDVKNKR